MYQLTQRELEEANLERIKLMKSKISFDVGYSDHTVGISAAITAFFMEQIILKNILHWIKTFLVLEIINYLQTQQK